MEQQITNDKATNYLTDLKISPEVERQIFRKGDSLQESVGWETISFRASDFLQTWNANNIVANYNIAKATNISIGVDPSFTPIAVKLRGRQILRIDMQVRLVNTGGINVPAFVEDLVLTDTNGTTQYPILEGIDMNGILQNLSNLSMDLMIRFDRTPTVVAADTSTYQVMCFMQIKYK